MGENAQFFLWAEALLEESLPQALKDVLDITGFTSRVAISNSGPSWLQEMECFIRQHADSDVFRARLRHGQLLQNYSIPPGHKAILTALRTKVKEWNDNWRNTTQPVVINAPSIQTEPVQQRHRKENVYEQCSASVLSVTEAEEMLDNSLRTWQRSHNIPGQVTYQVGCKQGTGMQNEPVTKLSATVVCPGCEKNIQIYMDESKRRWIISNLASHYNRQHRCKPDFLPVNAKQELDLTSDTQYDDS